MTNMKVLEESPKIDLRNRTDTLHFDKLQKVAEITYKKHIPEKLAKILDSIGLVWIVDENFISKFAYSATLPASVNSVTGLSNKLKTTEVKGRKEFTFETKYVSVYAGDIPDNILDTIAKVKNDTTITDFSIHSIEPLPIIWREEKTLVSVRNLPKTDPVIIGWIDKPTICIDKNSKFVKTSPCLGIVIGIWGHELQ